MDTARVTALCGQAAGQIPASGGELGDIFYDRQRFLYPDSIHGAEQAHSRLVKAHENADFRPEK